jgi:hypothetical protein
MHPIKVLLASTLLLVSGCATRELQIQGGGFRNLTDFPIENVELKVESTGNVASCSYISSRGFFATRFPLRAYHGAPIVVHWRSRGRDYVVGPFRMPVPNPLPDEPVAGVIRFHENGRATAELVPVSQVPSRYWR